MQKHVLVVELLLLHGASVQLLNKRQCTAIDCAEQVSGEWEGTPAPSQLTVGSPVLKPDLK